MSLSKIQFFSILCLFSTIACAKETNAYGWEDLDLLKKEIIIGKTTKEDIKSQIGRPTATDTTKEKEWYFVQLIEEGFSIAKPKVKTHKMLRITFDKNDQVSAVKLVDIKESELKLVQSKTKTGGQQEGFLGDTFGRIGQL